jgi:hypothetical protein
MLHSNLTYSHQPHGKPHRRPSLGSRNAEQQSSAITQNAEAHAETLRRFGVSEEMIEQEIAPVRRLFANWMASSVWPNEPGYDVAQ